MGTEQHIHSRAARHMTAAAPTMEAIVQDEYGQVIDPAYPLSEVPKAIQYLQEGRARGKSSAPFDGRTATDPTPQTIRANPKCALRTVTET